jgi:hypothetical protein
MLFAIINVAVCLVASFAHCGTDFEVETFAG